MNHISCKIVALRKNVVDRPKSYDLFSAKSCVFLAHSLGYISPFPYTTWPKARYQKNSYVSYQLFSCHHCLTKFDFPLSRDQTLRSRIWQIISEKFKCGTLRLLRTMSDIYKVSDGTRVAVKCPRNILIACFGAGCVWGWRNIPQTMHVFSAQEIYNLIFQHWTNCSSLVCQQNFPGEVQFRS
jgi:hypothetical protein